MMSHYIVNLNYSIFILDILLQEPLELYNHTILSHLIHLHLKIIQVESQLMYTLISHAQIPYQMINSIYPIT